MDMRQDVPVSWEKKKEIQGLGKLSTEMLENIDRVSQALTEDTQKLQSHDPVNWELADKIQEISKLLDEIQSPQLKDAIDRLNAAVAKLDKEAIAEAMAQCSLSQDDLMQGLDRAIELLKQIKQDEQLRALVEEAMRLAEKETELGNEMETPNPDTEQAAKEQEDIGNALDQLKQEMERLAKEAGDEDLSKTLEEICNSSDKSGLKDMISQSTGMLRSKKTASLRKLMRDIESALYKVADSLAGAEQQHSSDRTAEVTEKVRRDMHELLEISKAQEELSACSGTESCGDLALRQQEILDGAASVVDRLLETAKEAPFMTYKTSADLGKSLREMEDALRSFENKKTREGLASGKEALRLVNDVLRSLLVAEQSMCSGQGGEGAGSGFQRMRSLSGLQQAINSSTDALYSRLDQVGRLSESDEQALSRLGAQQEMVRQGMEDVSRAMGERKDILGRIEDIVNEMRGVEDRMEAGQLDERVLRQQNQILSRLLDAQKSVQQRDYSGKRYSRPGQDFPGRPSPPELPRELFRQSEKLELQMLRERSERYPETYRELVEQYLKTLSGGTKR
jgi:tetratricopeptide (TPR) repeat protein